MRLVTAVLAGFLLPALASAQTPDWKAIEGEAVKTLQSYIRIDTSVPPGNVTAAADLLQGILQREGIDVKRFESGQGRSILLARLRGTGAAKPIVLLHHMDVVPADKTPVEARSVRRRDRRRGDLGPRRHGHEGTGRHSAVRVHRAETHARAARSRHHSDGGARRGDRRRARRAVDARQPLQGVRAGIHPRRGRLRHPRPVRAGQARVRHLGGREEDPLAAADRGGHRRTRIAAARSESERPPGQSAGADAVAAAAVLVVQRRGDVQSAGRHVAGQQIQQRDPALDDFGDQPSLGRRRAAEGQRHSVNRGGHARLPGAAGYVEAAVAR